MCVNINELALLLCASVQIGLASENYRLNGSLGEGFTLFNPSITLIRFFPLALYAFSFHYSVIPIYVEMRKPSPRNFRKALALSTPFVAIVYILIGSIGSPQHQDLKNIPK